MFQARHYRAIAAVFARYFARTRCTTRTIAARELLTDFTRLFAQTNPRFDAARFTDAAIPADQHEGRDQHDQPTA